MFYPHQVDISWEAYYINQIKLTSIRKYNDVTFHYIQNLLKTFLLLIKCHLRGDRLIIYCL